MDRPEKLNSLTLAMYDQLAAAFKNAAADPKVGVCILTGAGTKSFCVGADLTESIPHLAKGHLISEWNDTHLKNTPMFKPIIGAVNGMCMGGGLELLLGTDIRFAVPEAKFSFPEVGIGAVPAGGSLVRLVRQISFSRTMELILTGKTFSAEQALAYNILNDVVEAKELMNHALQCAEQILSRSAIAVQTAKESILRMMSIPMETAFHEEALWGARAFESVDTKEGLQAFYEKRKPTFPSKKW
jgi:enoyl-CoA hydratase/carnithine racemase